TELRDPRVGFITVTRVELSPDYHDAKILYSVLGDAADLRRVKRMLDHACGFIQRQVASVLRTRVTPKLVFAYDPSIEGSIRVASIIDKIREEREAKGEPAPEPADLDKAETQEDDDFDWEEGDEDEDGEDEEDELPPPKATKGKGTKPKKTKA